LQNANCLIDGQSPINPTVIGAQIDAFLYGLYGLPNDEIKIVEEAVKK
jgi:hypothetical protein